MYIIEKQQLQYDNLLSYRARVDENGLLSLIKYIETNIDALSLEQKGCIVFMIDETIETGDKIILGVELLVPVNKTFESSNRYVYKSCFKLENAVMSKFNGKISELKSFAEKLCDYVKSKNMKKITDVYYLVRNIYDDDCIVDLYLGTSGNVL